MAIRQGMGTADTATVIRIPAADTITTTAIAAIMTIMATGPAAMMITAIGLMATAVAGTVCIRITATGAITMIATITRRHCRRGYTAPQALGPDSIGPDSIGPDCVRSRASRRQSPVPAEAARSS